MTTGTVAAASSTEAAELRPNPSGIIDCQSHLFVPEVLAFMEKRKEPPFIYIKEGQRYLAVGNWHRPMVYNIDLPAKLAAKDAAGIQMTALSTNDPGPEQFGADGPAVARMIHDYLASVVAQDVDVCVGEGWVERDELVLAAEGDADCWWRWSGW